VLFTIIFSEVVVNATFVPPSIDLSLNSLPTFSLKTGAPPSPRLMTSTVSSALSEEKLAFTFSNAVRKSYLNRRLLYCLH